MWQRAHCEYNQRTILKSCITRSLNALECLGHTCGLVTFKISSHNGHVLALNTICENGNSRSWNIRFIGQWTFQLHAANGRQSASKHIRQWRGTFDLHTANGGAFRFIFWPVRRRCRFGDHRSHTRSSLLHRAWTGECLGGHQFWFSKWKFQFDNWFKYTHKSIEFTHCVISAFWDFHVTSL